MKQTFYLLPFLLVAGFIKGLSGNAIPGSSQCKQEYEHFICHKTYDFKYQVEARVTTPASTSDEIVPKIHCDVQLNAEGDCHYTLKVLQCVILETDEAIEIHTPKNAAFSKAMERNLVGFTMSDGVVEELAAHVSEPPSILNFKRGIITAFITRRRLWNETRESRYGDGFITISKDWTRRTDVQGNCPVRYKRGSGYIKRSPGQRKLLMDKDLDRCHFPSRPDTPYSPFSLIWNTTFIYNEMFSSNSRCAYDFNQDGNLAQTECYEEHSLHGLFTRTRRSFTAVNTQIKQTLSLVTTSPLNKNHVDKTSKDYEIKHIQYEFERIEKHRDNQPDLKRRVHSLMNQLLTDPEKPIDPRSASWLDELVELLRNAKSLDKLMDQCWVSSTCTTTQLSEHEVQLGHIWKAALIQCNRAHCTKAFRSMLDWDPRYLRHVVDVIELDRIFFAWSNARITDTGYIESIIDIVKTKYTNRFSISVLSFIIYNMHKTYRENGQPIPEFSRPNVLEDLAAFIKRPIGKGCTPNSGYDNMDVAAALLAFANIVPLIEDKSGARLDLDTFKKCINGKKDHWPISYSAIQATKRSQPTVELHRLLWTALRDSSLSNEDHVMAYTVLAEKFGGENFLREILDFLEDNLENAKSYNLRTFIATHLRTVAKNKNPNRAEFAKAVHKAMVYRPNLFRALPEEASSSTSGKDNSYYNRQIPWEIRVDDDFIFKEGRFDKYTEAHNTLDIPLLSDIGYGYTESQLFKEGSYQPYVYWVKDYVEIFGQKFNVTEFNLPTRELVNYAKKFAKYWRGALDDPEAKHRSKSEDLTFPYKVDEDILNHLTDLHKEKFRGIKVTEENLDSVYQYGLFDNFLIQMSQNDISVTLKKYFEAVSARISSPYKSKPLYWKIVEAATVIPTTVGIPLNWTTDAYLLSNTKLESNHRVIFEPGSEFAFNIGGSFSGLTTLHVAVQFDFPGYASYGAQSFITVSTNVGADLDFNLDVKTKKLKVQLELPQRPMQLLSYRRTNSLIRNYNVVPIRYDSENNKNENGCSYTFSSLLGFKLCHGTSYVGMPIEDYQAKCSSLAGNSNWNYTTEHVVKHKVALQFGVQYDHDEKTNTSFIEAALKSRDQKDVNKFNTIVRWSHKVKKGEFTSQLSAPSLPTFNIQATRNPIGEDGTHVNIKATLYPGQTTFIDLLSEKTSKYIAENTMKSHLPRYISSSLIQVPVTTTIFNYTSSSNYYGYKYTTHEFPETSYTDLKLKYTSLTQSTTAWPYAFFRQRYYWDNDGSAWLKFHRESWNSIEHNYEVHRCYNLVKLPETSVLLTTHNGRPEENIEAFAFNLTRTNPENNELENFINFTFTALTKKEDGHGKLFLIANTTMPFISMASEFKVDKWNNGTPEIDVLWTIKKEELKYKEDYHKADLQWWAPNTNAFTSKKSHAIWSFHSKEDDGPEWTQMAETLHPRYITLLTIARSSYNTSFRYYKDASKSSPPTFDVTFQSKPTYISNREARYKRHFSIDSSTADFSYDSNLNLDFSLETEVVLWKSTLRLPQSEPSFYLFNVTSPPASGFIYVTEDLNTKSLKRNTNVVASYMSPTGEININSQSVTDPLLFSWELKAKYSPRETVIRAKHPFVDIDFQSNRQNGYSSEVNFKSKDTMVTPNMKWRVTYPDASGDTTISFNFPDINKTVVIFGHTELNSTRLILDYCFEKKCSISDIDSNHFITEVELSLDDPQTLTRTVSFNIDSLQEIAYLIHQRIRKTTIALTEHFRVDARSDSIIKYWLQVSRDVTKTAAEETFEFFFRYLSSLGQNFIETTFFVIQPVGTALVYPISAAQVSAATTGYVSCWYGDYNQVYIQQLERKVLEGWYTSGPISGKSYIATTQLPVYWTQFNKLPSQLSPSFAREIEEAEEEWSRADDHLYHHFFDYDYRRHALFVGTGDIYTFDGRVRHFEQRYHYDCPYLLSHDYEEGEFTIYYQYPSMHFLFPDLSLSIDHSGIVFINETSRTDLPFVNWNEKIRVVRKENYTILTTSYDLKVICTTNDFYCVFYTNKNKFSGVTGLLGNNNDNPMDEPKDDKKYLLSGHWRCRSDQNSYSTRADSVSSIYAFSWQNLLWDPNSPTLACHDIVSPIDFFASSYIRGAYQFPCALMNGYLALCSAKEVHVGQSPCITCKPDYQLGQTWESKADTSIDIVFIIDLTQRKSSKKFLKGVESLAQSFQGHFVDQNHYEGVTYGLVAYNGKNHLKAPQQHTMNGKLLSNLNDFVKYGLKSLTFDGRGNDNETAGLSAIEFAADHYSLGDTSTHIYVILTPNDPKSKYTSEARQLYDHNGPLIGTLHVFSDYKELADAGYFGVRDDGVAFSDKQGKFHYAAHPDKLPVRYPKGLLARLASLTHGTIWQLPYLEKEGRQLKTFNELAALEWIRIAKEETKKCKQCSCITSDLEQPLSFCKEATCTAQKPYMGFASDTKHHK